MELIRTNSFDLAIISKGDRNADKLAICIPGRLDTKDYANFVSHTDYLAGKGFFALAFDPPGTWDSPGGLGLFSTTNYIKAINELIEYFGNKPTLLVGHSRGAVSAILASSNPAVVGIVSIMCNFGEPVAPGNSDLQKGFSFSQRDLPPGVSKTNTQKEFMLPIAYWEDSKRYNQAELLKECLLPKLIVIGTKDEVTSTQAVKELYDLVPEPKMLKEVHTSHNYRYDPIAIEEVNKVMGEFLNNYVQVPPSLI